MSALEKAERLCVCQCDHNPMCHYCIRGWHQNTGWMERY